VLGIIEHTEYMADQDQKLCDNCHERHATNHISHGGRAGESRSLCEVCLMQDSEVGGMMQRFQEAVRNGRCKYCGAPAELGSGSYSSVTGDNFNLLCKACSEDFVEFVGRPENAPLDFTPGHEAAMHKAVSHLKDMERRKDEFIRQRVLERKSK
jgi:hypothetical protein